MLRLISAAIGIPIIFGILYFGPQFYFLILVVLATAIASYEYNKITRADNISSLIGIVISITFPLLTYRFQIQFAMDILAMAVLGFLFVKVFQGPQIQEKGNKRRTTLFGIFYVGGLTSFFILLRGLDEGVGAVMFVFCTIWICDSAAYYAGKNFGKHHLAPAVSPKKTIEGAVAGLLGSGIGAIILGLFIYQKLSVLESFIAGIVVSAAGQMGDLAESLIKREYSVKDSGSIIPGHGGILDRIDSQLFAAPAFYFYLLIFLG